jgi:hypothetical protein
MTVGRRQVSGVGMVIKQLSIAIAVVVSFCIGLGMVRAHVEPFAGAPISVRKVDFDQTFADVARQGAVYVDRVHKGDRLPNVESVSSETVLLPYCEPVASPYSDPILGRIVGRCAV